MARELGRVVLLIDVSIPAPDVHAFGELACDVDGVVGALRVDDDQLIGPRDGSPGFGDDFCFVFRDDYHGDWRHVDRQHPILVVTSRSTWTKTRRSRDSEKPGPIWRGTSC